MSFSSKAKNDLARLTSEDRCCHMAELSGILRVCGSLKPGSLGVGALMATENAAVARLVFTLFKKTFGIHAEVLASVNKTLNKGHTYTIRIAGAEEALKALRIIEENEGALVIPQGVPSQIIKKSCCRRAYLRGVFLGSGSVSDPEKAYHLEFVTHDGQYAESLKALINTYELNAKIVSRKQNEVVYLKEGDQIVDMLNIIGAHTALLAFEDVRIIKQMRNSVNRIVNCETANLSKTVEASLRQLEAIEIVRDTIGFGALSDSVSEIAMLRLDNPDMTLTELGALLTPPVGKSGVNHRLKKIEKIADRIRNNQEEDHDNQGDFSNER